MAKIVIVDDEPDLRALIRMSLEIDDHEFFEACDAQTGLQLIESVNPDLILLDVDMPDMDGREACRLIRKAGVSTPVIMLTGQSSDSDAILGLDSGANDYVTKPFRFAVLLARIRAHLRSHEQS